MAKRHSALVKQATLEKVAAKMNLAPYIRVSSKDAALSGSMIADVVEALLAAIYLDSNFETAEKCVQYYWKDLLYQEATPPEDAKSSLQEWAQGRGYALPEYRLIERTGPDHRPSFAVEVHLANYTPQRGEGASKQAAEKAAAQAFLTVLKERHEA